MLNLAALAFAPDRPRRCIFINYNLILRYACAAFCNYLCVLVLHYSVLFAFALTFKSFSRHSCSYFLCVVYEEKYCFLDTVCDCSGQQMASIQLWKLSAWMHLQLWGCQEMLARNKLGHILAFTLIWLDKCDGEDSMRSVRHKIQVDRRV